MPKLILFVALFIYSSFIGDGSVDSKLLHKKVSETPFGEYIKQDLPGKNIIMFVAYGCSHCWDATIAANELKKQNLVDNIIILGSGSEPDKQEFKKNTSVNYTMIDYDMETLKAKLLAADPGFPPPPSALYIKDNTLEKVFVKIPAPKVFVLMKL